MTTVTRDEFATLNEKVDTILAILQEANLPHMSNQLDSLDARMGSLDGRMDKLEEDMTWLKSHVQDLQTDVQEIKLRTSPP